MESSDEETLQISSDQDKPVTPELFTSESANVSTRNPSPERFDEMYLNFTPSLGDYLPSPPTGLTTLMPDDEVTDSAPDSYLPSHKISVLQGITAMQPADQDEDPKSRPHSSRISDVTPVRPYARNYDMNHKYRGKCVVFNIYAGDETHHKDYYFSASIANNAIERTFMKLGFMVETQSSRVHEVFIRKLKRLSEEDHEEADCICIFVLAHGSQTEKTLLRYSANEILEPFTARNCKTLAGKPKLFFIESWRERETEGTPLTTDFGWFETYPRLDQPDFCVAHNFVGGNKLEDESKLSTDYVTALCEELDMNALTTDFMNMLTKTNSTLNSRVQFRISLISAMEACIKSTFVRKVFLAPKN